MNLKQVDPEQDFKLKQCQSIAHQVVSSDQIEIRDAKVYNSSTLFKLKKRRSRTSFCNLLIMGSFLGLALTQQNRIRRKRRRRRRTRRSRDMSKIPLDLLMEILCRLPGKYLARFKCVSKQWSSLISSRYFCESSFTITRQKQQPHLYMCLVDDDEKCALLSMSPTSPDNTCFVVDQDLSIPGFGGYYLNDLHGLMCFSVGKRACIYNPSTGQRLTLPKIKADITADQGQVMYIKRHYIGYDPVDNQHKLLCTIVMYCDRLFHLKSEHWVFVLEAGGSWKKVVSHESYRPHTPFAVGQYCNSGSLVHYLAWHDMYTCAIVSFDFRSEELTTIIVPDDVRANMSVPALEMKADLIDYGGKLAIFEHSNLKIEGKIELWVLEDAEKKEWSKKCLVLPPCQRHLVQDTDLILKGTTRDGKVILAPFEMRSGFYIFCYDLGSNDLRKVDIKGVPHHWFDKECYYDLRLMDENESPIYLET
ncbi:F-box/LRR-repeat protein [Hirschfeldia incana]|nr:F-box/LRR-repeat protein [Hirschfeldia incana]